MEIKMNMKMKMMKVNMEYWFNDAERESFALPLGPHKSSRNWPRMEPILRVKRPMTGICSHDTTCEASISS